MDFCSRRSPCQRKCRNVSSSVKGKRISRVRSVARTVSSRSRIASRAMELVSGHESFLTLTNRGAHSILDASFKFARASYRVSGEPWSTVRKELEYSGGFYVSSAVIGVCVGLMSVSVRMRQKKGFAFSVREGCRELASEVGRV